MAKDPDPDTSIGPITSLVVHVPQNLYCGLCECPVTNYVHNVPEKTVLLEPCGHKIPLEIWG